MRIGGTEPETTRTPLAVDPSAAVTCPEIRHKLSFREIYS
jgi:hypothetical protein